MVVQEVSRAVEMVPLLSAIVRREESNNCLLFTRLLLAHWAIPDLIAGLRQSTFSNSPGWNQDSDAGFWPCRGAHRPEQQDSAAADGDGGRRSAPRCHRILSWQRYATL